MSSLIERNIRLRQESSFDKEAQKIEGTQKFEEPVVLFIGNEYIPVRLVIEPIAAKDGSHKVRVQVIDVVSPQTEYLLTQENPTLSFGRSEDINNVALQDSSVSRVHGSVSWSPDGSFTVTDNNSTNGTHYEDLVPQTEVRIVEERRFYLPESQSVYFTLGGNQQQSIPPALLTLSRNGSDIFCVWSDNPDAKSTTRIFSGAQEIRVGRSQQSQNDITLGNNSVSRDHLELSLQGRYITIKNLNQKNTTKVHSKPIVSQSKEE